MAGQNQVPAYQEIVYTLTEDDVRRALKISGYYRISKKRQVVQTSLLSMFFVFFMVMFLQRGEWFSLGMAVVCVLVTALLFGIPAYDRTKKARQAEKNIHMRVYPRALAVYMQGETVQISLKQAAVQYDHHSEIFTVLPKEGGFLAIALQRLTQDKKKQVAHLLLPYVK